MDERIEKQNKLAEEVFRLARNTLLVNLRFLDAALNELQLISSEEKDFTIATDGRLLIYSPVFILKKYKEEREFAAHAYLHLLLHCIFRHMFVHTLVNHHIWDLACDIAAEYVISDIGLKATSIQREILQKSVFDILKKEIKQLTAEKIYRYYLDKKLSPEKIAELRGAFYMDDHRIWYMTEEERALLLGKSIALVISDESEKGEEFTVVSIAENRWAEISSRIQMDMEIFSKMQGDKAGGLIQNLREVNREKYDYTSFLKKFAVHGEVMRVNDDEFDYVYYNYGLKLYRNMPLIEPLEYKEVKRIKEFVIAIDTSGSVSGERVQSFIQKTYNVLKSTESFFSKINLHIIQCDATVQEDAKITDQEEFDNYLKNMKIHGLGGTDFRPVFGYVDWLREKKEFQNLKGLIYFTDGFGTFPAQKPDYNTAFIFIDNGWNNYNVPAWAIKLVLQKEDI